MLISSANDQKARVYALADPALFVAESKTIEKCVLEALKVAPSSGRRVTISPSSGWLDYSVKGELWDRKGEPQLPDKWGAKKAAESALRQIEQKCSDVNPRWPKSLKGMALLPPVSLMRPAEIVAVLRPNGSTLDHWLYRAEPRLYRNGGETERVGVFGAQVEIRIGHGSQPITIRSRWRPLSSERTLTDPVRFRAPPAMDPAPNAEPVVNFLLEGDGVPQWYLALYYCLGNDHGTKFVSASAYSLTGHIARTDQTADKMTISAFARGGSGNYAYNWAHYMLARPQDGIKVLGSGRTQVLRGELSKVNMSSIDLPNGVHVILLNIADRATGAFKHEQRQVFSSPFGAPPSKGL